MDQTALLRFRGIEAIAMTIDELETIQEKSYLNPPKTDARAVRLQLLRAQISGDHTARMKGLEMLHDAIMERFDRLEEMYRDIINSYKCDA